MNPPDKKPHRLLIIDDEAYFVQFFKGLFEDSEVEVFSAETGRSGIEQLAAGSFDLIVIDYQLPDMLGTEILDWLLRHHVNTPAVMVTGYGSIDIAVQAMKGGAVDFFTKPLGDPGTFVRFVNRSLEMGSTPEQKTMQAAQRAACEIAASPPAEDPEAAAAELARVREICQQLQPDLQLTRREYEVITTLLRGLSNKEIAASLHISERTVKNHLTRIYKKFGIDSRPQLFNKILAGLG